MTVRRRIPHLGTAGHLLTQLVAWMLICPFALPGNTSRKPHLDLRSSRSSSNCPLSPHHGGMRWRRKAHPHPTRFSPPPPSSSTTPPPPAPAFRLSPVSTLPSASRHRVAYCPNSLSHRASPYPTAGQGSSSGVSLDAEGDLCDGVVDRWTYSLYGLSMATNQTDQWCLDRHGQMYFYRPCGPLQREGCRTIVDDVPAVCQRDKR